LGKMAGCYETIPAKEETTRLLAEIGERCLTKQARPTQVDSSARCRLLGSPSMLACVLPGIFAAILLNLLIEPNEFLRPECRHLITTQRAKQGYNVRLQSRLPLSNSEHPNIRQN
jgi:hypothetical protein